MNKIYMNCGLALIAMVSGVVIFSPDEARSSEVVCKIPPACVKPLGSKYSSGGGRTVVQYIQLDCYNDRSDLVSFIDEIPSLAGLLGLGRYVLPPKISFVPADIKKMECEGV